MASLQSDGLDDLLFDMYKKQVLKHLRSKMPPEMLRTLAMLKDGGACTSDFGFRMSRLKCFLASMVAGEDGHACAFSDSYLCGLKSRLESMFGSVMSKEFFFSAGSELVTPPLKRKDVSVKSPTAPVKRVPKKDNPMHESYNVDAKVLFPEVEVIHVVEGPSKSKTTKEPTKDKSGVLFIKEVTLNDRLNKLCKSSDALYNQNNVVRSKVDVEGTTTMQNAHSPSLSIVSGYRVNAADVGVHISESAKFPLTSQENMVYNAVCSLAKRQTC